MKSRINKNIFKFSLATVILGITVVGGAFALRVQATRNATTMPEVFYSEGASVRVTENERLAQMRFHMALENDNDNYKMWFDGTKAKKGVETGVICMPYDEYQLHVTEQCKFQLENLTTLGAAKTITTSSWHMGSKKIVSYAYLNAADIPTTSEEIPYNQEMIVRGYIKDKAGVVYTEPIVASMSDVAYQSQSANVKTLSAAQKSIVKETYMKDHAITIIPLSGETKVGNYRYGTTFSSMLEAVFFTDEKRTQILTDSYVTNDIVLYSATQAECNLGLEQLDGIVYNQSSKSVDVIGNTQISVKDDWFSAQIQGVAGVRDFELSVTYGGMEQYASNGDNGYIGIELGNADGQRIRFQLVENNQNVYKARTTGAYAKDNGWTNQKVTEDVTITLKRVGKQYTMSYGEETWEINSSELEKEYTTTSVVVLRFFACITMGIVIKDWKFTNLDQDSTAVSNGLNFYAMGKTNAMDEGAYVIENSNGDWSTGLNNAKAQKDFVISWDMKSTQKANSADGTVGICLTNSVTGKSVCFSLQHAYDNAGRAYIYSDSMNYVKGNLHSYRANPMSAEQWNLKLIRKADSYYLTLNGEKLWVGKATCMLNEVMIGDILGETVDIGFETKDWNVQGATWSISTSEADINAAIPKRTIEDGLVFYPMGKVWINNPESYDVENNQIHVSGEEVGDWFTAQILEANKISDFELSVTFGGMANYKSNGGDGRIGISFKNEDNKLVYFDLYEKNENNYYARMNGSFVKENGITKQAVTDEITIKLRRVGQHYTMTYGTESWDFYASEITNTSGTMLEQFDISEIHDLRFYAAISHGITIKDWNFTNLDGQPKAINEGLSFYSGTKTDALAVGSYTIENDQIYVSSSQIADWFSAKVVEATGVTDFEASVTLGGMKTGGQAGQIGIILLNEKDQYQRFMLKESGSVYHAELAQASKTGFAYTKGQTNQKVEEDVVISLKRQNGIYTFSYGTETWIINPSELKDGSGVAMEKVFATTELKELRFFGFLTDGMIVKSWSFENLDGPAKAIEDGLNFYAANSTNEMDLGAYSITKNNRIQVQDDWFTAQISDADGVQDFEISVTFSGIQGSNTANGARLGMYLCNENGEKQHFIIEKNSATSYDSKLLSSYAFTKKNALTSQQNIDEITVTLKRVGDDYTFTYGTEVWKFSATDLLDGTNSFESKFRTSMIKDLRIAAYLTKGVTIKSWSFKIPEEEKKSIAEGLTFMLANGSLATEGTNYTVDEGSNRIIVTEDWLTPKINAATGVKDFEVSATYSNLSDKPSGYYGFKLFQDNISQTIRWDRVNAKEFKLVLGTAYKYEPGVKLTSEEDINQITVTLKRVGKTYTVTALAGDNSAEWTFKASDKLNGTDTFESIFKTKAIDTLQLAPWNYGYDSLKTRYVTIDTWNFKNLEGEKKSIADGLTFLIANGGVATAGSQYTLDEEFDQIIVTEDWLAPTINAATGSKDFEVTATYGNLADKPSGYYGFRLITDGINQTIRWDRVSAKEYKLVLGTAYVYEPNVTITSGEAIDTLTVTLKRVGETYTVTASAGNSSADWEFKASDKLDGTNAFESKFATKAIEALQIAPWNFGQWTDNTRTVTIESWNFKKLDNQ